MSSKELMSSLHAELLPHDAGVYESPSLWHTVPFKSSTKATAPAHVSRAGASDVQTALVARRMNAQTQGSTVLETPLPADRMLAARAPLSLWSFFAPRSWCQW